MSVGPGLSRLGSAALKYAERGLPVFPCDPGGKKPLTRDGLHAASTQPEVVADFWRQFPAANIGLKCGKASKLLVLDIDGDEGFDGLRNLERQHGSLPATASVVTPRGGQHFYFRLPEGAHVRSSAGRLAPRVDVRAEGGYVIAPPSVGGNGRAYQWDEFIEPAPVPGWLLNATQGDDRAGKAVPPETWLQMLRFGIGEGARNTNLTRLVGYLLAHDLHPRVVADVARLVNSSKCEPPLPDRDVDRIVESIVRCELRKRGMRA